jgi:hypothetical protein
MNRDLTRSAVHNGLAVKNDCPANTLAIARQLVIP